MDESRLTPGCMPVSFRILGTEKMLQLLEQGRKTGSEKGSRVRLGSKKTMEQCLQKF